jgi:hypothetical protein
VENDALSRDARPLAGWDLLGENPNPLVKPKLPALDWFQLVNY